MAWEPVGDGEGATEQGEGLSNLDVYLPGAKIRIQGGYRVDTGWIQGGYRVDTGWMYGDSPGCGRASWEMRLRQTQH